MEPTSAICRLPPHIFYLADAKQLVEYGVNGLAHSVRDKNVDASLIAAMKEHGTWQLAATLTREASMFSIRQDAGIRQRSVFHAWRVTGRD